MYITHVREDFDSDGTNTAPPIKPANGSVYHPEWIIKADIEILMQFDYNEIDGFNTFVKAEGQYFMMMSIDLE